MNYSGSIRELGGNCALLAAASCQNTDIFQYLLRHRAPFDNAYGRYGDLLQTVAHLGDANHMKAILEARPNVEVDMLALRRSL